jgi:peroxiredoxin
MPPSIFSVLRSGLILLSCATWTPLRADFELTGALPARFATGPIIVRRESLETRTSIEVARAMLSEGNVKLRVPASCGLFTVELGELGGSFVAADGQALSLSATDEDNNFIIAGAPDQALFVAYEALRAKSFARLVTPEREGVAAARSRGDEPEVERFTEREVAGFNEHRRELNDFTLDRLKGSAALYAASLRWDGDYRLDELDAAVAAYAKLHPTGEIARLLTERIARFRAIAIGATAPDLAGPTPDGATLKLSSLRGRTVLVDFWASWCGPCRVENRHYVELYRRYRHAGFEILAVSVDQNGPAWKAAIAKDAATWRHISDLTGWKTPLAAAYNVAALPASFLIDPTGKIIAKDLRGLRLTKQLEQIFSPAATEP